MNKKVPEQVLDLLKKKLNNKQPDKLLIIDNNKEISNNKNNSIINNKEILTNKIKKEDSNLIKSYENYSNRYIRNKDKINKSLIKPDNTSACDRLVNTYKITNDNKL